MYVPSLKSSFGIENYNIHMMYKYITLMSTIRVVLCKPADYCLYKYIGFTWTTKSLRHEGSVSPTMIFIQVYMYMIFPMKLFTCSSIHRQNGIAEEIRSKLFDKATVHEKCLQFSIFLK